MCNSPPVKKETHGTSDIQAVATTPSHEDRPRSVTMGERLWHEKASLRGHQHQEEMFMDGRHSGHLCSVLRAFHGLPQGSRRRCENNAPRLSPRALLPEPTE